MSTKEKEVEPKKRAEKYDKKLAIKGTFEDVVKASFLKSKKDKSKGVVEKDKSK